MKTAHTPGPWQAQQLGGAPQSAWAICAPGDGGRIPLVCAVEYSKKGPILFAESASNARLIAAAPELLDAVQALMDFLEPMRFDRASDDARAIQLDELARAAIAKATGDAP